MSEKYLLQRKPSGFLGNSPVWWAKGGRGYTSYLQGAEIWDDEEAMEMVERDPEKWRAYKLSDIMQRTRLIIDTQDFPVKPITDAFINDAWYAYVDPDTVKEILGVSND